MKRNLFALLGIFALSCINAQDIIWDRAAYNLFPDVMRFTISDYFGSNLIGVKEAEFDFINELIVVSDTNSTFDVKGLMSFGSVIIVLQKEPKIIKNEPIGSPLNNKALLQKHHRNIVSEDLYLNTVKIELRKGVIYTRDRETKYLGKSYEDKVVEGKLLWINQNKLWLLEKEGSVVDLSAFQVENITMNGFKYDSIRMLYDAFYTDYQYYLKSKNEQFLTELKNSTLEELIAGLGAYTSINLINGRTFIDWKYALESYDIDMSNQSISTGFMWSSGGYLKSTATPGLNSGSVDLIPSIRSSLVSSYYFSNRQSSTYSSSFSTQSSTEVNSSYIIGGIERHVEELSIVIELGTNSQVINVIQNGVLTEPVYGLAFSFY